MTNAGERDLLRQFLLDLKLSVSSVRIPPDQIRAVSNISMAWFFHDRIRFLKETLIFEAYLLHRHYSHPDCNSSELPSNTRK